MCSLINAILKQFLIRSLGWRRKRKLRRIKASSEMGQQVYANIRLLLITFTFTSFFLRKSGWNENYHPRDSSSGDGESMEPAWWRSGHLAIPPSTFRDIQRILAGPGANSEYTGHAMDGELYNPPDAKVLNALSPNSSSSQARF